MFYKIVLWVYEPPTRKAAPVSRTWQHKEKTITEILVLCPHSCLATLILFHNSGISWLGLTGGNDTMANCRKWLSHFVPTIIILHTHMYLQGCKHIQSSVYTVILCVFWHGLKSWQAEIIIIMERKQIPQHFDNVSTCKYWHNNLKMINPHLTSKQVWNIDLSCIKD